MEIMSEMTMLMTCLWVILLSSKVVSGEKTSDKQKNRNSMIFKGFHETQNFPILDDNDVKNLDRVLNFMTENLEFQPLVLAIGSSGSRNDIDDRLEKYLTNHMVDHYRFDIRDFADGKSPNLQYGTTWIIVVDDQNNLKNHIRENSRFWRATDRFFVIYVGKKMSESSNDWSKIFEILWNRHRVCKILITSINEKFQYLRRYMPLEKMDDKFGTVELADVNDLSKKNLAIDRNNEIWMTINKNKSSSSSSVKLTKRRSIVFEDFQNFNGYPINVTIFPSLMMNVTTDKNNKTHYTMLDAKVMKLVENRMNSKFRVNVIGVEKNGDPFMNALDTLDANGHSEIVFTGYFEKLYLRPFTFTSSIFEDKVCLIAPSSEPIPKFFMPVLPFSNELWFLLGLYNLVVAVLWLVIQRIQSTFREKNKTTDRRLVSDVKIQMLTRRIANRRDNIDSIDDKSKTQKFRRSRFSSDNEPREIHPWIVRSFDLFTLASYPLYGGKTCTERAFLFGTLFFGLIVIGLYQSYLVSSLSKPLFYPELRTLSDVVKSNRTIITKYENLRENTFDQGTDISDRLRKKIEISTSKKKTYDMVVERGLLSIGRFTSFQLEDLTEYYNKVTNKLSLHMVEECAATYPLSYPVRLESPYLERIDDLLLRIQQNGFIHKWYDDMLRRVKIETAKRLPRRSNERAKLTVEHLSLVFLGLGIGLFCSTLVFIGELRYARKLRL